MRARCGLYPTLGRYFRTMKELADAGSMSQTGTGFTTIPITFFTGGDIYGKYL